MKKFMVIAIALSVALFAVGSALAKNPLADGEKAVWKTFEAAIPKAKHVTVDDLYKKWQEVMAGKSKAILLDVRTHPEFNAFHVEGSSHIHSGHMYTIPKKIKDPNAEIWVFCRTQHRAAYVAGILYKYGYKNVYYVSKAKDGAPGGIVGWVKRGYPVFNYYFGFATAIKYVKPGAYHERGHYIREFGDPRQTGPVKAKKK